ncbi:MAG: ABC transporter ATP-binding protein [Planctomycetota bacterium]|nr:MAG: ABC transporter ATP-binding protein [Planctomycetota bacterium]
MHALAIDGLRKRFGRSVAVEDVSLRVETGQIHGLLGPNGSGKTTTLRCALGLLRPDAGSISVLGLPPDAIHRTAGRVAVVFDRPQLLPNLDALANLAWARRLLGHSGGRSAHEALELVGIPHLARHKAGNMSLGQSRRLSIARALLGRPELLVLDEPLSGLDAVGVRSLLQLFISLREAGHTLLLSSHRLHELERVVDRITVILAGRVVRQGALSDVLSGPGQRLVLRTPQRERAVALLGGLPAAQIHRDGVEQDLLHVEGLDDAANVVARVLVEGGCPLTAVHPERRTLAAVFDDLVDAAADQGASAAGSAPTAPPTAGPPAGPPAGASAASGPSAGDPG